MIEAEAFSAWAEAQEPTLTYAVLMAATVMEYLVPILPSELIPTLLAVVHAASERRCSRWSSPGRLVPLSEG